MRPAVAAAPYLRRASRVRSEDGDAGIRETVRALLRAGPGTVAPSRPASAPASTLPASGVTGGHQSSRPKSASLSASSAGQRLCSGASSSTTRPSSESPCRGGRTRSSTSAAIASAIAHSRLQVASLTGTPAADASIAAKNPSSATNPW